MSLSRRDLLCAGGAALAASLSGCTTGEPSRSASLTVEVAEPFDAEPPVTVPVTVDARVRNVEEQAVALRGVALACYDADRTLLATRRLGDFARQAADPERRHSEEHDRTLGTTTTYGATWAVEREVEVGAVPHWIGFRVDAVEFGPASPSGGDQPAASVAESGRSPVGSARASQSAPELSLSVAALPPEYEVADPVAPDDYVSLGVASPSAEGRSFGVEEPFLPHVSDRWNGTASE